MQGVTGQRTLFIRSANALAIGLALALAAACTSSGTAGSTSQVDDGATTVTEPTTDTEQATSSTLPTTSTSEQQAEAVGWDAVPVCGADLVGFTVDGELSSDGWIAAAQIDRASIGLASDIQTILDLDSSLSPEHLVANGYRTVDEQDAITEAGAVFDVAPFEVLRSLDDLEALRTRLAAVLPDWWLYIDGRLNAVTVNLGASEPSDSERWPFTENPEGVCRITGNRTGDFGPQPSSGDGWRLLAITDSGQEAPVQPATTDDELAALWADLEVPDDVPDIDFTAEVVTTFLELRGFRPSCDRVIFDGVKFGDSEVAGKPRNVAPVNAGACRAIGIPRTFVVALDRTRIPDGPFLLRRDVEPWSYDVESEQIRVDLKSANS